MQSSQEVFLSLSYLFLRKHSFVLVLNTHDLHSRVHQMLKTRRSKVKRYVPFSLAHSLQHWKENLSFSGSL